MPLINNLDSSALETLFQGNNSVREANAQPTSTKRATTKLTTTEKHIDGTGNGLQPGASQSRASFISATMRGPYANSLGKERRGFVLTSDLWISQNKALMLHAGPSEVAWTLGLRASTEDIKDGRAHYMQSRSSAAGRTYFNLPTAAFTFQTGNILPIPISVTAGTSGPANPVQDPQTGKVVEGPQAVAIPYGLQDFYYFMDLVNQDPLIPSGPNEGAHNYLWVFYTSRQFPQIVLKGFIEPEGVSWSDSAEAPNSFTWSASMAVYESAPEIWNAGATLQSYTDFEFTLF